MKYSIAAMAALGAFALASVPANAQYADEISNDLSQCDGSSSAMLVTVTGFKKPVNRVRVVSYRALDSDWLKKNRWLNRIDTPVRAKAMKFCMPMPGPGTYAVGVRHDFNGNDDDDPFKDGWGMSNNPSIGLGALLAGGSFGKPPVSKARIKVGSGVTPVTIKLKYP